MSINKKKTLQKIPDEIVPWYVWNCSKFAWCNVNIDVCVLQGDGQDGPVLNLQHQAADSGIVVQYDHNESVI